MNRFVQIFVGDAPLGVPTVSVTLSSIEADININHIMVSNFIPLLGFDVLGDCADPNRRDAQGCVPYKIPNL